MEREARHAWFTEADTVAHAESVRGIPRSPSGCAVWQKRTGGCALRAYPRLLSVHPSGVLIHALKG